MDRRTLVKYSYKKLGLRTEVVLLLDVDASGNRGLVERDMV